MLLREPLLVTLVRLVAVIPMPQEAVKRGHGRPKIYSDKLVVQAFGLLPFFVSTKMEEDQAVGQRQ